MDMRSLLLTEPEALVGVVDIRVVNEGVVDDGVVDDGVVSDGVVSDGVVSDGLVDSGAVGGGAVGGVSDTSSSSAAVNAVNGMDTSDGGATPSKAIPKRSHLGFQELASCIRERIQYQTCSRVRNLTVDVTPDVVILQGRCATFYTKQLAQHAAMGVLEDEVLVNDIFVVNAR